MLRERRADPLLAGLWSIFNRAARRWAGEQAHWFSYWCQCRLLSINNQPPNSAESSLMNSDVAAHLLWIDWFGLQRSRPTLAVMVARWSFDEPTQLQMTSEEALESECWSLYSFREEWRSKAWWEHVSSVKRHWWDHWGFGGLGDSVDKL